MPRLKQICVALSGLLIAGCATPGTPDSASEVPKPADSPGMSNARAAQVCVVTGRQLDRNGYPDDAISEYVHARDLDPSVKGVAKRLAVLYDRQGNDRKAMEEYRNALREAPFDVDVLNDLGYFYIVRNDGPEAEPWLRLAITKDAKCSRAWVNLGTALAEQRKYHEAYGAFTHVLTPAQADNNLGMIEAQQGDYREAARSLAKANEAEPNMPQTQAALRWVNKRAASQPSTPMNAPPKQ